MFAIRTYSPLARSSLADFVREHPHPFLVYPGTLRPLDPKLTRAMTVDRLVLEGNTPTPTPIAESFQVAELVARTPESRMITIGVSSTCDVRIDDASLSKQHAWFDRAGESWRIWDNDSIVGTQVNNQRVAPGVPTTLAAGDRITLGYIDLMFVTANAFHTLLRSLYAA